MDEWLRRYGLQSQSQHISRTYVTCRGGVVVGFYSLCAASVEPHTVPDRIKKGLPRYPMPVTLLTRMAVDHREHGQGLGAALLKDALLRYLSAADVVASRALLVHALDEKAAAFYRHFGFEPSSGTPLHLFLSHKEIRKALR